MSVRRIEVSFSPAEFQALSSRDLSRTTCVVFDILRATTTIVTALANGATAVTPVNSIAAALEERGRNSAALLAGEREGFRITRELTGSVDFDLGNSPRDFTADRVGGREIVITTTNGSRALCACSHASSVYAASFLNLRATARACAKAETILAVCSGTHEEASYEDTLAAGALVEVLDLPPDQTADSAQIARQIYQAARNDLFSAMSSARNGRRLLSIPELKDDVRFCLQQDIYDAFTARFSGGKVAASQGAAG